LKHLTVPVPPLINRSQPEGLLQVNYSAKAMSHLDETNGIPELWDSMKGGIKGFQNQSKHVCM